MRKKKEIQIGKAKVILSERNAQDVFNLAEYIQKEYESAENKMKFTLISCTLAGAQSIKQTARDLPWYRIIQKLKYRKYTSDYLFYNCSLAEIDLIKSTIDELEDSKKKVVPVENQ